MNTEGIFSNNPSVWRDSQLFDYYLGLPDGDVDTLKLQYLIEEADQALDWTAGIPMIPGPSEGMTNNDVMDN